MSYDDKYYLLKRPRIDNYPLLIATVKTAARDYEFDPVPPSSEALFFQNEEALENPDSEDQFITPPILITGVSFITIGTIKRYLTELGLKGMRFHPAVYIAGKEDCYEDYWYLNIYTTIDCWDRDKSKVKKIFSNDGMPLELRKIVLDEAVLDSIDEENRLIFRMGSAAGSPLLVHQRIIDYFEEASVTGYRAFKVNEYQFGMEFRS